MSLWKYLKPSGSGFGGNTNPQLPDPNAECGQKCWFPEHAATALPATSSRKRSSSYHRYELEMKAKIGGYAAEMGTRLPLLSFLGI